MSYPGAEELNDCCMFLKDEEADETPLSCKIFREDRRESCSRTAKLGVDLQVTIIIKDGLSLLTDEVEVQRAGSTTFMSL